MQLRLRTTMAASALLLLAGIGAQAAEGIRWRTDLAAAKSEAKRSHKLIFTDFYGEH
jgi:hypothetical protein